MTINYQQLRNEIWPMGAGSATSGDAQLQDYALAALDMRLTELERRITSELAVSKALVKLAESWVVEPYFIDDQDCWPNGQ